MKLKDVAVQAPATVKHKLVHLEKLWNNFYNENCL